MSTKTHRSWGTCHHKRPTRTAVFVQFAKVRRIAEATAKNWYYGVVGSPLWNVCQQAAVAARMGHRDMVEGFLQAIRAASETATDLTARLISETQRADLAEDQLEEIFRLNPCRKTWLPLRKAKLEAIALEHELIAAGDEEYRA